MARDIPVDLSHMLLLAPVCTSFDRTGKATEHPSATASTQQRCSAKHCFASPPAHAFDCWSAGFRFDCLHAGLADACMGGVLPVVHISSFR
jgi:hypothetical protein